MALARKQVYWHWRVINNGTDVFLATDDKDNELVIKLHRLGRISFRQIKNKRDYLLHRKSASWLYECTSYLFAHTSSYLSRLAALKEYAYMKALHENGFPVPQPMDVSRHCLVMKRIKGYPLYAALLSAGIYASYCL